MVNVPISIGELVDKITILEIKRENIKDVDKKRNVELELEALGGIYHQFVANFVNEMGLPAAVEIHMAQNELKRINKELWNIEDQIRVCMRGQAAMQILAFFDLTELRPIHEDCIKFVKCAHAVPVMNDRRAAVKKRINEMTHSGIVEEKSYESHESKT